MVRVSAHATSRSSGERAVRELVDRVHVELGARPELLVVMAHCHSDLDGVAAGLERAYPAVATHAGTTALGVLNQHGVSRGPGSVGVFALSDPAGSYGTGWSNLEDAAEAAVVAAREALLAAERPGELPGFVWLSATPGAEEGVVDAIRGLFGEDVPILGGSHADDAGQEDWAQLVGGRVEPRGVLVSVGFPSTPVSQALYSGYVPTGLFGHATRVDGRELLEIDGEPAARVYARWQAEFLGEAAPEDAFTQSALFPVARRLTRVGDADIYAPLYPRMRTARDGVELFAEVGEGDVIELMRAEAETLVRRAGRAVKLAVADAHGEPRPIAGALLTYFAGSMFAIEERMEEVAADVSASLDSAPFVLGCTFGEQGHFLDGRQRHGNMLVGALLFHRT